MNNNWYAVWSRRQAAETASLCLKDLIALDGFDSGAGKIDVDDWREYARLAAEKININNSNSVYEVGCGGGAFLFALREQFDLKVGGNDYSSGLINAALRVFPECDFKCMEAASIDSSVCYDFVISNGVFHYFDLNYAKNVLVKMLHKARRAVCVLEIPDLATQAESEQLRREMLSIEEYESKYAGLHHTYYDRDWFSSIASEYDMDCEQFDGFVPGYAQNKFRFGCIIRKPR